MMRISGVDHGGEGAGGSNQFPRCRIGSDSHDRHAVCSGCHRFCCRVFIMPCQPLDRICRIPEFCHEVRIRHRGYSQLQTVFFDHASISKLSPINNAYNITYACIMHLYICFIQESNALKYIFEGGEAFGVRQQSCRFWSFYIFHAAAAEVKHS